MLSGHHELVRFGVKTHILSDYFRRHRAEEGTAYGAARTVGIGVGSRRWAGLTLGLAHDLRLPAFFPFVI
jgi:hypothetical protein